MKITSTQATFKSFALHEILLFIPSKTSRRRYLGWQAGDVGAWRTFGVGERPRQHAAGHAAFKRFRGIGALLVVGVKCCLATVIFWRFVGNPTATLLIQKSKRLNGIWLSIRAPESKRGAVGNANGEAASHQASDEHNIERNRPYLNPKNVNETRMHRSK